MGPKAGLPPFGVDAPLGGLDAVIFGGGKQIVRECGTPNVVLFIHIPQQQNFAMGSLAQISSGAIRCNCNTRFRTRFRRVLVLIPCEVPEVRF